MANPSFAHVLCTTSSAADVIGTSAEVLFDTDHGSVVFSNNISDNISWDQTAGTFTFSRDGIYHVIATLISAQSAGNRAHTVTFTLNGSVGSTTASYTGSATVRSDLDPIETTHQKLISISAGDVLYIEAETAAATLSIEKGSALNIIEVTSDVYASSTVTTVGTNNTTDEFNPYDVSGDGPAFNSAGGAPIRGILFAGTGGSWTVPVGGTYLIMVTNFQSAAATTDSDIAMALKEGSNVLWTSTFRGNNAIDPIESTACVIEDLAAAAVLTVTWDIGSGQCQADLGSTFTVYKLDGPSVGYTSTKYISVVNKADLTATASEVSPFDEDSYSSADFDTRSSNGIVFTPADGKFTVAEKGTYFIMYNSTMTVASDAVVTFIVKVGGAAKITADSIKVDSFSGSANRTISGILDLDAGDEVTVTINSNSPNIQDRPGSSITILKLRDWLYSTAGSDEVDDQIAQDFTLNTFSQKFLSTQYKRDIAQVPFIRGIPGPNSLRGRTNTAPFATIGDKKN